MLVYHGSNCDIDVICLTRGSRYKDFGQGFYVTPELETAQRMARKKVDLFNGEPTIEPSHHQTAELLIDDIISEMTKYLMEDYDFSLEESLDKIYTSKTIELLQNEEAELYVQSPAYVYDMLIKELKLYPKFDDTATSMVAEKIEY